MNFMKRISTALFLLSLPLGSLYAQKQESGFSDRLLLDLTGKALAAQGAPAGIGGGFGIGLAFRDFNLFFNPTALIGNPGAANKIILTPTFQVEAKITILPNFITLLPYVGVGGIAVKFTRADGSLGSYNTALYAEGGVGAEILLTHEISFIPRVGFAYAPVYEGVELANYSGPTISASLRYTFGRTRALDF